MPYLKARAIVANDLNDLAINFYRTMTTGPRDLLIEMCQHTLSHPSELKLAQSQITSHSLFQRAWAYWAICWIGRKGKGGTKNPATMPSVRRTATGGTNASRIRAAADDLKEWAKHFERCEWECLDFLELLLKVADNPECGIYCDPPWVGAGRDYLHTFSDDDHINLNLHLSRFKESTVVIRYGDHPMIRRLYNDWTIIDASSRTQANSQVGEIWICNKE